MQGSTSIDEETKKRVSEVLKTKFMSSEDSVTEDDKEASNSNASEENGSESDGDSPRRKKGKKKLIRHKLPWRSNEFQRMMDSLDQKLERKRTPRGKSMCLKVEMGGDSTRPKPDNLPDWVTELFD